LLSEAYVKVLSADFYQPLFSVFPSTILFPFKSFPHQKAQSKSFFPIFKDKKPPKAKSQAKNLKAQSKTPKEKSLSSSFQGLLQQQTGWSHGEGRDIVTRENCIPCFPEHNLRDIAVLSFPVPGRGLGPILAYR
jgi:hypothetical protein